MRKSGADPRSAGPEEWKLESLASAMRLYSSLLFFTAALSPHPPPLLRSVHRSSSSVSLPALRELRDT